MPWWGWVLIAVAALVALSMIVERVTGDAELAPKIIGGELTGGVDAAERRWALPPWV